jgi:hypothetical protein
LVTVSVETSTSRIRFETIANMESQKDGRIRHWGYVKELGRYLRVVTLSDGETIYNAFNNAFRDRNFKGAP